MSDKIQQTALRAWVVQINGEAVSVTTKTVVADAWRAAGLDVVGLVAPQVVQAAVPVGMRLVPVEFVRGFSDLAHNYSLAAVAPDYYHGVERDAFRAAYERCGRDLAKLREILSATPAHPAGGVPAPFAEVLTEQDMEDFVSTHGFTGDFESMARIVEEKVLEKVAATQPAAQGMDAKRLDFIENNSVSLEPEWEGPWTAMVYREHESPSVIVDGKTPRQAIDAAMAALAAQAKQGGA